MFIIIQFLLCLSAVVSAVERVKLDECLGTYNCYVPETCLTDTPSSPPKVVEVSEWTLVSKDCAAIIRFHVYADNWWHVSIESLNKDTTSIIFNHKSESEKQTTYLECKMENNEVNGRYNFIDEFLSPPTIMNLHKSEKEMIESRKGPMKCTFDVNLATNKKVIDKKLDSLVHFDIESLSGGQKTTLSTDHVQYRNPNANCDPSRFQFRNHENTKVEENYAAVPYAPGEYGCKGTLFKRMEYKLESSDVFKIATKLSCKNMKFSIILEESPNAIIIPVDEDINIRCVADAKYFCDYDVKTTAPSADGFAVKPLMQMPDKNTLKAGEIKCPPGHPFLELNEKPIVGGKIKCQNRDGDMLWVLNEKELMKNNPKVRCVKELECHKIRNNKIPASSIKKGTLINHVPACRSTGIMKAIPDSAVVSKVYCDGKTGKYMYTTEAGINEVGNTTFTCEYPDNRNAIKRKSAENKSQAITTGGITAAGIICGAIILFVVVFFSCWYLRIKRHRALKQKTKEKDQEEWNQYGVPHGEKDSGKKEETDESQNKKHASDDRIAVDLARHGQDILRFSGPPIGTWSPELNADVGKKVILTNQGVTGRAIPVRKIDSFNLPEFAQAGYEKMMSSNPVMNIHQYPKEEGNKKKGKKEAKKDN